MWGSSSGRPATPTGFGGESGSSTSRNRRPERALHPISGETEMSYRSTHVRRSRNGRMPHTRRLYRGVKGREERAFVRRYGPRGHYIYGATVGKVHREQVANLGRR